MDLTVTAPAVSVALALMIIAWSISLARRDAGVTDIASGLVERISAFIPWSPRDV